MAVTVFTMGVAMAGRPLLPVDDAAKDPAFFVFRARLQRALTEHDAGHVISILSPKVLNSFGGDGGIEEFKEMWKIGEPESELWATLGQILALGGKFNADGSFEAPYVSAAWPDDLDGFEYGAIIGDNVRVREKPDRDAAVIGRLSFEIVRVTEMSAGQEEQAEWAKVELADGRAGYVSAQFIEYVVGWRAFFQKENGQWKLTTLVAGD